MSRPPLTVHVVHRLDIGGLENGLVNLIDHLPRQRYRHAIVCLEDFSPAYRRRIRRDDVEVYALGKRPGKDLGVNARMFRLLRKLRPEILHTRNLGTLEHQFIGAAAGVAHRVHGEHGWDIVDLHGDRASYRLLRRLSRLVVHRYVPMSQHLASWLHERVGVPAERIVQIYNGVDAAKFRPAGDARRAVLPPSFATDESIVIGTVGRLAPVKDQLTLVRAFVNLVEQSPGARRRLRLAIVGDGPLLESVRALVASSGVSELCWLAGSRDDVSELLRAFDIFVLPSLNEGISNTILEAMATALPVVATAVGGNSELVLANRTGLLCPPENPAAMAAALCRYADDESLRRTHGTEGRQRVVQEFTLPVMIERYARLYDELLARSQDSQAAKESA
jgi:sugar transferase (PEP-CTERM/EpsH1 system associated)